MKKVLLSVMMMSMMSLPAHAGPVGMATGLVKTTVSRTVQTAKVLVGTATNAAKTAMAASASLTGMALRVAADVTEDVATGARAAMDTVTGQ